MKKKINSSLRELKRNKKLVTYIWTKHPIPVESTAIQVPLWAILTTLYYLVKGKIQQVIRPERRWGPGDKEVRQQSLECPMNKA